MDKARQISKLMISGDLQSSAQKFLCSIKESLCLFGGLTVDEFRKTTGASRQIEPVSKELYNELLAERERLRQNAEFSLRALMQCDERILQYIMPPGENQTPVADLPEIIRACSPLIVSKKDWAALYMLLEEKELGISQKTFCQLVHEYATCEKLPSRQNIYDGTWVTGGKKFPDWEFSQEIDYEIYQRHWSIAKIAYDKLAP